MLVSSTEATHPNKKKQKQNQDSKNKLKLRMIKKTYLTVGLRATVVRRVEERGVARLSVSARGFIQCLVISRDVC